MGKFAAPSDELEGRIQSVNVIRRKFCVRILITFLSSIVVLYGKFGNWVKEECRMQNSLSLAKISL